MKTLFILMLTILAINVSYAGYGEDMKGSCVDGKDSSRGQEEVVTTNGSDDSDKEVKTNTADK